MSPLLEDRLPTLAEIHLSHGGHESFAVGVCAMEMVAYLAGEPHSDKPECTCPVLTKFLIAWNDGLPSDAERDRLLKPFLPRLIGTRSTPDVEERRAFLATDWLMRTLVPMWLDRVEGLASHAAALRALDRVEDLATVKAATPSLRSAADAAGAARAAAWAAVRAAARDAAGDAVRAAAGAARAAAWAAVRAAAWDAARDAVRAAAGDAARAAAWAAAWDAVRAAAGDAARAAAWDAAEAAAGDAARAAAGFAAWAAAWAALAPTVLASQASAGDLLDRMIAVTPASEPKPKRLPMTMHDEVRCACDAFRSQNDSELVQDVTVTVDSV